MVGLAASNSAKISFIAASSSVRQLQTVTVVLSAAVTRPPVTAPPINVATRKLPTPSAAAEGRHTPIRFIPPPDMS